MPQVDPRVAPLEDAVGKIQTDINNIKEKLLPYPWKAFAAIGGAVGGLVGVIVSFYVFYYAPTQISHGISQVKEDVRVLGQRFDDANRNPGTALSAVNVRVDGLEGRMTGLEERMTRLETKLDDFIKIYLTRNPRELGTSLERARPKKPEEAKAAYSVTRELLETAKRKRVPLKPEDFKNLALPLLSSDYGNEEARQYAWRTAKEYAHYRTVMNRAQFGVKRPREVSPENYFDGGSYNLGSQSEWKDTVFVNCSINLDQAEARLVLDNVRFINCTFEPLKESDAGKTLLEALFTTQGPAVSAKLLDHQPGDGKDKS